MGAAATAAAQKPTNSDLRRCSPTADPAFVGFAASLRAQSSAELGTHNYARDHNPGFMAESSILANHRGSPALCPVWSVTRNTFVVRVCYGVYAVCHRQRGVQCGSLRSTSPAAGSRVRCLDTVVRPSTS